MAERLPMLPALRAFEAVARNGSVRRAAAELFVTPAAVSQQVKSLEADLGIQLIRRRGNSLELTDAARAGSDTLIASFRLMAQAVQQFRDHKGVSQLRLSVDPVLATHWLIARLPRYRALPGSIDLLLDATRAFADFTRDQVDAAIRFGSGNFPGLAAWRMFGEELFPVCSPKLLRGKHGLKHPSDLRHHTLLHSDWLSRSPGIWPDWSMWLTAAGADTVDGKSGIHFNDTIVMLEATLNGQGVALGNSTSVRDMIAAKKLVAPFAGTVKSDFCYHFVCPERSVARPEIILLRDWLLAEAAHYADEAAAQVRDRQARDRQVRDRSARS